MPDSTPHALVAKRSSCTALKQRVQIVEGDRQPAAIMAAKKAFARSRVVKLDSKAIPRSPIVPAARTPCCAATQRATRSSIDRLTHKAHILEFTGAESYRFRERMQRKAHDAVRTG